MAECDVCEIETVAFIVGNAETGDQQFLGPACFARMGLEFAKALLPAEEIAAALGPLFVNPAETPPSEAVEPRSGSKRKRAATEPQTAPRPPEGSPAADAAGSES